MEIFFISIFASHIYCQDSTGTVKDIDGNLYKTIKIGNQWWMAENLKVTHFRNGQSIKLVRYFNQLIYDDYSGDSALSDIYGYLYAEQCVLDKQCLCPLGWHIPSDDEWQILIDSLGGSLYAGGKMKEAGNSHWKIPNRGGSNISGFNALPGGGGSNDGVGSHAYFWSSDGKIIRIIYFDYERIFRAYHSYGMKSVRCVKD